ncbi:AAA family ATPase [Stenotrophomonas maltophilia]|uniref:AAA family ATPase n=1 Tax=Stenotrophomonas maltophilia TaxID=40324 RepID=UPI001F238E75|nr:AAA family ATPase [Stenotrophomonas maltophilia]MCF3492687.1 AAA family ATPase [Stenotrophomonas maltophilia]MCF3512522.1 AAA family ATPase [Stenotrophomonas maltophilia]
MTTDWNTALPKSGLGYTDNKKIPITRIAGLKIDTFRTLADQMVVLGDHLTIISGRNGTMKTSILGLIAHPFDSNAKDAFGAALKTPLSNVFKLSTTHDTKDYGYTVYLDTPKGLLAEKVSIYWVAKTTNRHRIVVSGAEKGDGNFSYNTTFLNLKRLYPLVDTKAKPSTSAVLSASEAADLIDFYESVFPSTEYSSFTPVQERALKTTFGPSGAAATYDWSSISSGEDNLGAIFNRLLGFSRQKKTAGLGNGILCIDEMECSLHPVAQTRLMDYLYRWSKRNSVQVVITTHSLHLIQHTYATHAKDLAANRICINFISKSKATAKNTPILHNPPQEIAFKELTFTDPEDAAKARKVDIFCEDDHAIHFAKRLIKKRKLLDLVQFHSSLAPESNRPGTSYSDLAALCIRFPLLIKDSLVLFDADVPATQTDAIADKSMYFQLPDKDALAIERRIIIFIISLSDDDEFFSKFKKEKEAFLADFKDVGIRALAVDKVADEKQVDIKTCKKWADSDPAKFRMYVTHYANTLDGTQFRKTFIDRVNNINLRLGLPPVSE